MENNHLDVTTLLSRLINQNVPKDTTERAKQKYLGYFMRIMGARLQSANFKDASSIKSLITRKLSSSKSSKLGTKNTDLQRFEDLYNKLKRKDINKTNVLYLLYKISNIESVDLFKPILPTIDNNEHKDENDMEVDEDRIAYPK